MKARIHALTKVLDDDIDEHTALLEVVTKVSDWVFKEMRELAKELKSKGDMLDKLNDIPRSKGSLRLQSIWQRIEDEHTQEIKDLWQRNNVFKERLKENDHRKFALNKKQQEIKRMQKEMEEEFPQL